MTRRIGWLAALVAITMATGAAAEERFKVDEKEIDDPKMVYAEVRSVDTITARARIGGTIAELTADEGNPVKSGDIIARIGDTKLALKLEALLAQRRALEAQVANAKAEFDRNKQLFDRGIIAKAKLDQVGTEYEVAQKQLEGAEAERSVVQQQMTEGEVIAPADGRILSVPVTVGSVVMAGESIATIAAEGYILRLEVPERHARFMHEGDTIKVGGRGLEPGSSAVVGTIEKVYPELQSGRVVADAKVPELGDYFVGERALVQVSAGKRKVILLPRSFVKTRFGVDYVKLAADGGEPVDVVVQLGRKVASNEGEMVEVLSGLRPGDEVVAP